jgi:hypothetical protein
VCFVFCGGYGVVCVCAVRCLVLFLVYVASGSSCGRELRT